MGAFEKVKSGFPDMDGLLDYIRTGDNVVWRVGSIEEFRYFAKPFARQAVKEGRNLIYMRFASHEPILEPEPGIKICEFDPDKGFEAFTVDIYNCITREGREAFYVFDSLSSLQSVWYTDLMMGNFFRVTCPYLFKLDTVAYFPLLRGKHSFHTVSRIRDTTQLLLDVHSGEELYLHPLKVWNRYTPRMFLPHCMDPGSGKFRAVEDGVSMSRYYQHLEEEEIQEQDQIPLWLKKEVMERDYEAEDALKRMNRPKQVWFVTCQHLLENQEFTRFMQAVLKILEEVYGNPVDIEYTVNLNETGRFVVNLLQCRPLYTGSRNGKIDLPDLTEKEMLFDLQDSSVGNSVMRPVDLVIRVDARAYYEYPYHLKSQVAEAIGEISRRFSESGKNLLLLAPGRIGTSSPELGVPVTFSDISGFSGICEVSDKTVGYMPELSYGSHMFQDLVEADIYYAAVWNDSRTKVFHPELLDEEEDLFPLLCPERKELSGMIQVTMPEQLYYWNDVMSGRSLCGRYRKENDKKDQVKFLTKK